MKKLLTIALLLVATGIGFAYVHDYVPPTNQVASAPDSDLPADVDTASLIKFVVFTADDGKLGSTRPARIGVSAASFHVEDGALVFVASCGNIRAFAAGTWTEVRRKV